MGYHTADQAVTRERSGSGACADLIAKRVICRASCKTAREAFIDASRARDSSTGSRSTIWQHVGAIEAVLARAIRDYRPASPGSRTTIRVD